MIELRDDVTSQKLLEQKKLTLSQTVDVCRAQEAAKTQTQVMSTECTLDKLHTSNHYSRKHHKPKRYTLEQGSLEKKEVRQCGRCGKSHRRGSRMLYLQEKVTFRKRLQKIIQTQQSSPDA